MKRLAQFLLLLSCTSYAYDNFMITNTTITEGLTRCLSNQRCRGPRGPRGHRGPRGLPGPDGTGGGARELFLNPWQMTRSWGEGPLIFPDSFFPFSGYPTLPVAVWTLFPTSSFSRDSAAAIFNIPSNIDTTQPVTVVLHFVIQAAQATGNQAKILLEAAYASSGQVIGSPGFNESVTSPDFTITEPAPLSNDLMEISVTIPLNPALMTAGNWAYLKFSRTPPASNEYDYAIFLTTMSLQYTAVTL